MLRQKASWAGLIYHNQQHYRHPVTSKIQGGEPELGTDGYGGKRP